jgi:DNA/RNA-binding domain of Phe-tRNA-synthetase-like protein
MALVSAEISDYNAEIATIVRSDHAVLVNVHDSMTRQRSQNPSSLFSPDDFDLSTTGHALAAHLFISAWRRANQ